MGTGRVSREVHAQAAVATEMVLRSILVTKEHDITHEERISHKEHISHLPSRSQHSKPSMKQSHTARRGVRTGSGHEVGGYLRPSTTSARKHMSLLPPSRELESALTALASEYSPRVLIRTAARLVRRMGVGRWGHTLLQATSVAQFPDVSKRPRCCPAVLQEHRYSGAEITPHQVTEDIVLTLIAERRLQQPPVTEEQPGRPGRHLVADLACLKEITADVVDRLHQRAQRRPGLSAVARHHCGA